MEEIKNKIKVNKYWYYIPVFGNIIYTIVVEFFLSDKYIKDHSFKKSRKIIRKYKSIFNLSNIVLAIPFLIYGGITKGERHFWEYWPFIFLMSFGGFVNFTPIISWSLYNYGYKKYIASLNLKQNLEA